MGKMLIYGYLPMELIGMKTVEEMDLDEFFRYVAMAQRMRDMRVDEIAAGVAKALGAMIEETG